MNWEKKRVFLTGADGFIGSHLAEMLAARGATVRALSLYNSFGSCGWLDEADPKLGIEVVSGDVRDRALVAKLMRIGRCSTASLIAIRIYAAPASYADQCRRYANVMQARSIWASTVIHTDQRGLRTGGACRSTRRNSLQPQSPQRQKIAAD
jgi:nucleoside-diphosphate-sugar epimerase